MKLLMENWRSYCRQDNFGLLLERYDNKQITEKYFFDAWERQFLMEERALLEEGLWDIISKGLEAGKEMFKKAWDKITGWMGEKFKQLKSIIDRLTPEGLKSFVAKFKSLYAKVSSWCGENIYRKILCTIGKSVLIALLFQGFMVVAGALGPAGTMGAAQAAIEMPSGAMMNDNTYETMRGAMRWAKNSTDATDTPALRAVWQEALNILDSAYHSEEIFQLKELHPYITNVYESFVEPVWSTLKGTTPATEKFKEYSWDLLKQWKSDGLFSLHMK
tara:strand:+ start:446 stop:1270 length:825 start_codon:yes stop_codon:yes gene_type:complete